MYKYYLIDRMNKMKWIATLFTCLLAAYAIFFVLQSDYALVANPKGLIARLELDLIVTNILVMLSIILPTLLLLFLIAWKYRGNQKISYQVEHKQNRFSELFLWIPPSIVIAIMIAINWKPTHELDPYQPIQTSTKPLNIQVLAMDWKWLFIYPEQEIATINFIQIPAQTPIQFSLSADDSPMNSFWIPQLSGQVYTMTGMITRLHLMADEPGKYLGRAAEINGEGLADMTFTIQSGSLSEFEEWVDSVKKTSQPLTDPLYQELVKPSINHPIAFYSNVPKNLFHKIVMKYLPPHSQTQ